MDRRLRSLSVLELVNVVWLPVALYGLFGPDLTPVNVFLTGVALAVLVQGALYWRLKRRQLQRGEPAPQGMEWFRALRLVNWVLIIVGWGWLVWHILTSSFAGNGVGLLFGLLAVAEQVNYFSFQLMYDSGAELQRLFRHGLRRSHLARDLARRRVAS